MRMASLNSANLPRPEEQERFANFVIVLGACLFSELQRLFEMMNIVFLKLFFLSNIIVHQINKKTVKRGNFTSPGAEIGA
jgi:hypothetical protein